LAGRVLILDDVITAGTSVRESVDIIRRAGAEPCGVLIALDRQEKGHGDRSAIDEVRERFGLAVHSIVGLADILRYLEADGRVSELVAVQAYRDRYGV